MNEEDVQAQFDEQLGKLIRHYRQMRGLTQAQLGKRIGVTFQQVQKYERATNRVSTATFDAIRKVLDIPIHKVFSDQLAATSALLTNEIDAEIIKKFVKIKNPKTRAAILKLLSSVAENSQ